MIECNTFVDANAHKEITKNACLAALIQLIAGVTGLVTYIVLGTLFDEPWTIVFLIFSLPFASGLVSYICIKKSRKSLPNTVIENKYRFEDDFFSVATLRGNEVTGTSKIYYRDLIKVKEKETYIFMFINKLSFLPISKNALTREELLRLRKLLHLK